MPTANATTPGGAPPLSNEPSCALRPPPRLCCAPALWPLSLQRAPFSSRPSHVCAGPESCTTETNNQHDTTRGGAPELGATVRPIENQAQAAGPTEGTPQARRNLFSAAEEPEQRRVRIRLPPLRYIAEAKQADRQKVLSPVEEMQKEINRVLREQVRSNQEQIERTAEVFECPLMQAQPRKVLVTPNGIRHEKGVDCKWLGLQMSKVAIASDGLKYDFSQITKHIRKNMHRELRSPVTGESITAQVYYTIKCKKTKRRRKGNQIIVTQ